jgi:hypothetical protein
LVGIERNKERGRVRIGTGFLVLREKERSPKERRRTIGNKNWRM